MTGTASYHPTTGLMNGKSDLGSSVLNYGENGQPPHALTSISGTPSLIPPTEQSITYTDFKKVSQILENDNLLDITYGVGDQRIKTVLSNLSDSSGTLTRYYTGNYEEEIRDGNTRKIHYINGGNGLAAIYIQNAEKDTLYYAHTDYQGSLLALSLTNGTIIERYAYDPWGKRLNPLNWMQADTRKSLIIHRGYTMHEHLPEFNLINMNGWVYDPLVAQFLSLDPYVQAPGNWLNYNRYAYCYNNPLIYTDPDGEWIHIAIGAAIGGIINWVANGADFSWKGLGYFGVGAAAGAAGAVGGAASGFVGGAGNAWINGANFSDGFKSGFIGADSGALSGGLIGGGTGGIASALKGGNFWTGKGATSHYYFASDDNTVTVGKGMEYSNEYARSFSDEYFGEVKNLDNLYADGSMPGGLTKKGDLVFKGKDQLGGSTVYNGIGKGSNVYLYKAAFTSMDNLYVVMGHEYIYVYNR